MRIRLQPAGQLCGIFLCALHADSQCPDPAHHQPAVKRSHGEADCGGQVAEPFGESGVSENEKTADGVMMAAEEFRSAVDDDVCAEVQRILGVGGQEGVVHDQEKAVFFRDAGELFQIRHAHHGIGGRLEVNRLGGGTDEGFDVRGAEIRGEEGQAVFLADFVKEPDAPAVQVFVNDQLIPGSEQLEKKCDGRHAAGQGERLRPVLQSGDDALELLPGRIGLPGIVEAVSADFAVGEGRRLIDRETDGVVLILNAEVHPLTLGLEGDVPFFVIIAF